MNKVLVKLLTISSLFILIPITNCLHGQNMKYQDNLHKNFNGWEFLEWKLTKKEVDIILRNKGIEIEYTYSNAETGSRTRIQYQKMETWLHYSSMNQLTVVEQHKDFHVTDDKKAKKFYKKVKKEYIQKYGKPDKKLNDKKKETITIIWNLNYTRVCIVYDYQYKIIDELGCGSYWVDIRITPVE